MRFRLAGISSILIAVALAPGAIALAQNSVAEPATANATQVPQPAEGGVNWKGVGVGAGTVAGNVFYMPAKIVYGVLGGIAGGAGYALTGGNKQVADTIWRSSLGGDYILTPDMITGKDAVHFSGPTQTAPPSDSTGNAAPSNASSTVASTNPVAPIGANGAVPSSLSSASVPASDASALTATHPIDSGAGPVRGPVNGSTSAYSAPAGSAIKRSGSSAFGGSTSAASKGSSLPSTTIE